MSGSSLTRHFLYSIALLFALAFPPSSHADAPFTEFFAVDTAKLTALVPTDATLYTLSSVQLAEISIAHGSYDGGLSMAFDTATFRIDARFDGAADFPGRGPAAIIYHINAGHDRKGWDLLSTEGKATKQGEQYITEGWRKQPVTVILRFLNAKP